MHHFLFPILSISTGKHVLGRQRQSPLSRAVVRFSNLGGWTGVGQIDLFLFFKIPKFSVISSTPTNLGTSQFQSQQKGLKI